MENYVLTQKIVAICVLRIVKSMFTIVLAILTKLNRTPPASKLSSFVSDLSAEASGGVPKHVEGGTGGALHLRS